MQIEFRQVKTKKDWFLLRLLYREAFPAYERKPVFLIKKAQNQGNGDVLLLYSEGKWIGMAVSAYTKDLVLLDYFAIRRKYRGKGFGTASLKAIQEHYQDKRFFLEIESPYDEVPNQKERIRRKAFYLANGMKEMRLMANLFGTEMEMLTHDCEISFTEWKSIYVDIYGPRNGMFVEERPYPKNDVDKTGTVE